MLYKTLWLSGVQLVLMGLLFQQACMAEKTTRIPKDSRLVLKRNFSEVAVVPRSGLSVMSVSQKE